MANKPLKTITFPGLADTYTVPVVDNTLATAGAAADAKKTGDELTQLKADLSDLFSHRLLLYPCMFIGNAYVNGSGTVSNNTHSVASVRPISGLTGRTKVYTEDTNLYFWWKPANDGQTSMRGGEDTHEFYFDGNDGLSINILRADGSAVTVSDLSKVYLESSETVYNDYVAANYKEITGTNRFPNYGGDSVYRYGMYDTAEQLGFLQRSRNYYRTTVMPYTCKKDVTLYCGKFSTNNTLKVVANGELTTIGEGQWLTIPANTPFIVSFQSDSTNGDSFMSESSLYVVKDSKPEQKITQYLSSDTITRADAAFIANGKVFTISRENEQVFSVYENGEYIVKNAPLDHTAGHANSCNYADGKVYVSDWNDCTLIHVFDVDTTDNTLTYEKDILIPRTSGDTEYFVANNEKEIYFLGWKTGDSATDINTLCYGLYVYDGNDYVLAWERYALRPILLQGFTKQDADLFYIENTKDYQTTAIYALSMATGVASASSVTGTLANNEGESIIPIDNRTFMIVDKYGHLYIKTT